MQGGAQKTINYGYGQCVGDIGTTYAGFPGNGIHAVTPLIFATSSHGFPDVDGILGVSN